MNTEKNEVAAITGTTESGFRYTLAPDTLDDYELLENLCDMIMEMPLRLQGLPDNSLEMHK